MADSPDSPAPAWFRGAIAEGLQRLTTLRLDGGPPKDAVVATAAVWVDALWSMNIAWDQALDAGRLQRAFSMLAGRSQRWPNPATLREVLPARTKQARLPAPPISPRRRAEAHAMIARLRWKMAEGMRREKEEKAQRRARIEAAKAQVEKELLEYEQNGGE